MGLRSIVSGCITLSGHMLIDQEVEETKRAIASYPFDEVWPFTNIFWCDTPARYHGLVVGFAGSYKQVEEVWSEWLWKFSQLLITLDAMDARVTLDCIMGTHTWRLLPRAKYEWWLWLSNQGPQELSSAPKPPAEPMPEMPASMVGQRWGIVEAPEDDFSIDPEWLANAKYSIGTYEWDKFVERWPKWREYL